VYGWFSPSQYDGANPKDYSGSPALSPASAFDGDFSTYWSSAAGVPSDQFADRLVIEFPSADANITGSSSSSRSCYLASLVVLRLSSFLDFLSVFSSPALRYYALRQEYAAKSLIVLGLPAGLLLLLALSLPLFGLLTISSFSRLCL
jgi:hypothetical protein